MDAGVIIINLSSTIIDAYSQITSGAIIEPFSIISASEIGAGARIGPGARIYDSKIGRESQVRDSTIENAKIGEFSSIGPYAFIRAGSVIGDHCKIGDFVEVKNSKIGNKTKASHLGYIGDAEIGEGVNFGCGAITVNYDGVGKFKTFIGDKAFIGSNSNLIAPIILEDGAYIAAGSTITSCVPKDYMAIARPRQQIKKRKKNLK